MAQSAPYGLVACFGDARALRAAAISARDAGYTRIEAFTPLPDGELSKALDETGGRIPLIALACGLVGAAGAYALQYYSSVVGYPVIVGGKPFHSWPPFLVLTFEIGVLCAVLGAVGGMLVLNRLPEPYHPIFDVGGFERVDCKRYYLCIRGDDATYEEDRIRGLLEGAGAIAVQEVSS